MKDPIEIAVFKPLYAKDGPPFETEAPRLSDCISFPRRNAVGSVLCGLVIIGAHMAMLEPFLASPAGHKHSTFSNSPGTGSGTDSEMEVTFFNDQPSTHVGLPPAPLREDELTAPAMDASLEVPANIALDDSEPLDPGNAVSVGDSAAAGRYLGQVNARIERAWIRPHTPAGASTFTCTVEVDQDERGIVLAAKVQVCNGTYTWQQSLIDAIHTASPMPVPPDPHLFRHQMRLVFESDASLLSGNQASATKGIIRDSK